MTSKYAGWGKCCVSKWATDDSFLKWSKNVYLEAEKHVFAFSRLYPFESTRAGYTSLWKNVKSGTFGLKDTMWQF